MGTFHVEMTMKRAWLAIPAMAMCMGLAFAPVASAQEEVFKFEDFFKMADTSKDGMMSKQEFMTAAGVRYDAMMAKMKKMPADKSKMMMKGDLMTKDGAKMFLQDSWTNIVPFANYPVKP
jgi:hypothetical protein